MATRFVLSIDGGGVRGLVAAVLLEALDEARRELGATRPLADCFDLIAGTSTGAIIAAGLAAPNAAGDGPRHTPASLRRLYRTRSREIFPLRFWGRLPIFGRLRQFFGPLYSSGPLVQVLAEELGSQEFAGLRRNLFISAYSIDPREAAFFRGGPDYKACVDKPDIGPYVGRISSAVSVNDAVIGSAAAPTFFPPRRIVDHDMGAGWTLIDGGVFLNDPALAAFAEAATLFPDDDIRVVSVGTGRLIDVYPFESARGWGFFEWLSPVGRFRTPLLSAMSDGQSRAVNDQLEKLLGPRYDRFDYDLAKGFGSPNVDDASNRNLKRLEEGASRMAETMRPRLIALAEAIG